MTAFLSSNIYIFACKLLKFVTTQLFEIIAESAFKSSEPQYILGSLKAVIKSRETFSFFNPKNSLQIEYFTNGEAILIDDWESETSSRKVSFHGFFSTFINIKNLIFSSGD
jgi:hypothetical protein